MKKNMKSILLSLGAAAVVAAPIAGVISCSGKAKNWNAPDPSTALIDSTTLAQLNEQIDTALGEEQVSSLKIVEQRLAAFMYQKEFDASFQAQIDEFKWEIHQLRSDVVVRLNSTTNYKTAAATDFPSLPEAKIHLVLTTSTVATTTPTPYETDLTAYTTWSTAVDALSKDETEQDKIISIARASVSGTTSADKDKQNAEAKYFEDIFTEINDTQDKIDLIEKSIADKTTASDKFDSADYPIILLSIDQIREAQEKIHADEKNAFISGFGDKAEGQEKWLEERSTKYGVDTEKEAIDAEVQNRIGTASLASRSISIISDFRREKMLWIDSDANNGFQFLKDAIADEFAIIANTADIDMAKRELDDQVWFYGTHSLISEKRLLRDNWAEWKPSASKIESVVYKHALIKATPAPEGETLPWIVGEETIRHMFQPNPFVSGEKVYQTLDVLWNDQALNGPTDHFLKSFSDNGGTRTKGGSLGITGKGSIGAGFNNGFSLGTLAYDSQNGTPATGTIYNDLMKAFDDAYKATFTTPPADIRAFNQQFDSILADPAQKAAMLKIVGEKIRDALGAADGRDLVYRDIANQFAITSKDGIHLISETDFTSTTDVSKEIQQQLVKIAEKKSASADDLDLSKYLNGLLGNTSLVQEELKTGTEFRIEFDKYLDTLSTEERSGKTSAEFVADIITSLERLDNTEAADIAIGYSQTNTPWLISEFDSGMIDDASSTIQPKDIYETVFKLAGGHN